jgi:hypothetical protein
VEIKNTMEDIKTETEIQKSVLKAAINAVGWVHSWTAVVSLIAT